MMINTGRHPCYHGDQHKVATNIASLSLSLLVHVWNLASKLRVLLLSSIAHVHSQSLGIYTHTYTYILSYLERQHFLQSRLPLLLGFLLSLGSLDNVTKLGNPCGNLLLGVGHGAACRCCGSSTSRNGNLLWFVAINVILFRGQSQHFESLCLYNLELVAHVGQSIQFNSVQSSRVESSRVTKTEGCGGVEELCRLRLPFVSKRDANRDGRE